MERNEPLDQTFGVLQERVIALEQDITRDRNSLQEIQTEISTLNESVSRVLTDLLPKVQPQSHNQVRNSSDAGAPSGNSPSSTAVVLTAARNGDVETLFQQLEAGEDIRIRGKSGESALHLAAAEGHERAVIVLLGGGASVNASGPSFRSPLHLAAAAGHATVARRLLRAGAKVDAKDVGGHTPLALAVRHGHSQVVADLLSLGASSSERDKNGDTPLISAVKLKRWEIVKIMVEKDVSLDDTDKNGNSAIVHAARWQKWTVVRLFCDKGASVKNYKGDENCPLRLACSDSAVVTVIYLLRYNSFSTLEIVNALSCAEEPTVVWAFEDAISDILRSKEAEQAMRTAAKEGRPDSVALLLDVGISVNASNHVGYTALHWACNEGQADCVNLLLERNALKDSQDAAGNTPLHLAATNGHEQCVRILIEAGADIRLTNKKGLSAYDIAFDDYMQSILSYSSSQF